MVVTRLRNRELLQMGRKRPFQEVAKEEDETTTRRRDCDGNLLGCWLSSSCATSSSTTTTTSQSNSDKDDDDDDDDDDGLPTQQKRGQHIPIHELMSNHHHHNNKDEKQPHQHQRDDSSPPTMEVPPSSSSSRRRKRKNDTQTMLFAMASSRPPSLQKMINNNNNNDSSYLEPMFRKNVLLAPPRMLLLRQRNHASRPSVSILEVLPASVIGHCFFGGYLDTMEVLTTFRLISKEMSTIAQTTVQSLDLRRNCSSSSLLTPKHLQRLVQQYPHITSLDVSYGNSFTDEHLKELVPWRDRLTVLRLKGTQVTDEGICHYFSQTCRIQELDVSAIHAQHNHGIGDTSVTIIAKACPHLRQLSLGWCRQVTNASIPSLLQLTQLQTLDLSLTSITTSSCPILSQLIYTRPLIYLDVGGTALGGDVGIHLLFSNQQQQQQQQQPTTTLQQLSLRFLKDISWKSITHIHQQCPHLQQLDISHCDGLHPTSRDEQKTQTHIWRSMQRNGITILKQRNY